MEGTGEGTGDAWKASVKAPVTHYEAPRKARKRENRQKERGEEGSPGWPMENR